MVGNIALAVLVGVIRERDVARITHSESAGHLT